MAFREGARHVYSLHGSLAKLNLAFKYVLRAGCQTISSTVCARVGSA